MAANPQYITTPIAAAAAIVQNTDRTGATGSFTDLITGGANGTRVIRALVKAQAGILAAGNVLLWLYDPSAGGYLLFDEIGFPIHPTSAGNASWTGVFQKIGPAAPLVLPQNWKLAVTKTTADSLNGAAWGGDF